MAFTFPAVPGGPKTAVSIRKMNADDLVDVKHVDLVCWNDLWEREYGHRPRLSARSDANLLSYMHSDPDGALVAVDGYAGVIGCAFSHVWGTTGWIGPLSVLPSYQSRGLGKDLLKHSLEYLEDARCVDIGLETMPENQTNLGMYLKVGLRPEGLIIMTSKKLEASELEEEPSGTLSIQRLSESSAKAQFKEEIRRISGLLRTGLDYSVEVDLTEKFSLGDTILVMDRQKVVGFAVVHLTPRRMNASTASIRTIGVDPQANHDILASILATSELLAADAGMKELTVSVPTACRRALDSIFSRGYQVYQSFERMMWMGSSGISEKITNLCSWSG